MFNNVYIYKLLLTHFTFIWLKCLYRDHKMSNQLFVFFACFGPLAKPSWCNRRRRLMPSTNNYGHKKRRPFGSSFLWCPEQDLNLHSFRNTHLKRARLPIPPPGHLVEFPLLELGGKKKQPSLLLFCAQDKTWTCTALRRLPPQSSVSTNSTTWANGVAFSVESGCKSTNFFRHSKIKIHLFWTKIPNILKYKADNTPIFLRQKADCEGKIGKIKSYFEKNGGCFWLVFSFFWSSKKWREFLFIKN